MFGRFTLYWTSLKNIREDGEIVHHLENCLYELIYQSSSPGCCIIRILVTIWCSNKSSSVKCTHLNFWYPDKSWVDLESLLQYYVILAASVFLFCVVLGRNCYACFIFSLLFVPLLNVSEIWFANVCVFVYTVCVPILFSPSLPWSLISCLFRSLWTIAVFA